MIGCVGLSSLIETSIIWLNCLHPGGPRSICGGADDQNFGIVIWRQFLDNSVVCHATGAAVCGTRSLLPMQWVYNATGTKWSSSRISTTKTGSSFPIRTVSSLAASYLAYRRRLVAIRSGSASAGIPSRVPRSTARISEVNELIIYISILAAVMHQ